MKQPTLSTKMKSISNNKKSDKMLETLNRVLASDQSLKKTKKSQYPTILVFYYRKDKNINSNQMEYDQSRENSIDPIKEEEDKDLDSCEGSSQKGSSQKDEDLDSCEGPSQKDKDLDSCEGYSQKDEDLHSWVGSSRKDEDLNSCEGSSQKDEDLDSWEGSSQKDEDLDSCQGSSQEGRQD
ncbi:sperm protein associated with the nucleus on the X chromosome N4-like [Saimiri boliviensis]|uniref:sperm protein associated with the nucleus on the X chromosome N4-like n=1 Tax=Saimiri boliviensis TaxID=27679 RepID=UPI00193DB77F|nr:sperm protein associated with the nucleus on the X chromosome N2-like [Saimiri boliviensis boliviensis]